MYFRKRTKKDDMSVEHELTKFLDIYFYNQLSTKCKHITRITDKEQQIKGVDVIIEYENFPSVYIDEKAQMHYMDTCLNTFAFEISFIDNSNNQASGWLFNHNLLTDTYMLIWPLETIYHTQIISITDALRRKNTVRNLLKTMQYMDFKKLECYLIKRESIKKFLSENGWNEQKILEMSDKLRTNNQYGKTPVLESNSFYFYYSKPLEYGEAPINIVIRKNILYNLAYKRYLITTDYVKEL